MSSSQTPNPKNVTGAEDVVSPHGSALELKKALKKCLRKPRAKLNGETLARYLKGIRRVGVNAEFNGALCRGLLAARFDLDSPLRARTPVAGAPEA